MERGEKASCSSLRSGCCLLIPLDCASLFAAHVGSVGVWVWVCFLQSLCRPSPEILQIAACKAKRTEPRSITRPGRIPTLQLYTRPLPSSKAPSKPEACRYPDPPGCCRAVAITQQYRGRMQKLGAAKGEPAARSSRAPAPASQRESGCLLREGIHPRAPGPSDALFKAPVAAGRGLSSTELTG